MELEPYAPPSALLGAKTAHSTNQKLSNNSLAEQLETLIAESVSRPPARCVVPSALPLLAILLSFMLVSFICNRSRAKLAKVAEPGPRARGLAGSGFSEDFPSSPHLELLCAAAQDWAPLDPSPGVPRESPVFVESFFQGLEGSAAPEENGAATAQAKLGRPDDDSSSDGEQPGPSCKYSRTEEGHQRAVLLPQPPFSGVSSAASSPITSDASPQAQAGPSPPMILPLVSGNGPSTSTASLTPPLPRQATSGGGQRIHPYVRRPALPAGVTPRPWKFLNSTQRKPAKMALLKKQRALLRQATLSPADVEELMDNTEMLANFAMHHLRRQQTSRRTENVVYSRCLKFVVFNALHDAAMVISPQLPPWWQPVADAVLENCSAFVEEHRPRERSNITDLAKRVTSALKLYRKGGSPSPEEIVSIMTGIFCEPDSPYTFRATEWRAWRQDGWEGGLL